MITSRDASQWDSIEVNWWFVAMLCALAAALVVFVATGGVGDETTPQDTIPTTVYVVETDN